MTGRKREKGFTLIEMLMVISIMGVILAIGTFNFTRMAPSFRLRATTEQVAARLQLLKMRAVATNRRAWFVPLVTQNAYSGFIDALPYATVQAAEFPRTEFDMANTIINIVSGSIPGVATTCPGFYLPSGITFGVPSPAPSSGPDGVPVTAATKVVVNGVAAPSIGFIGFRESGLALVNFTGTLAFPNNASAIFLKNNKNEGYAVTVIPTGRVRVYKWTGSNWR
jgi:prepilin-type N-terminal cleavage/methylation domain-containing protein